MNENLNKKNKNQTSIPKKINISKYEDISADEIPMQKLNIGLWWLKNKNNLRRGLILFLTIISFLSWGYTFYNFGYYLFKGMEDDQKMLRELVETKTISNVDLINRGAKKLIISAPTIIPANNKYDIYVVITNPNKNYWATFSYCFINGFNRIECNESFIFPNDRKNISALAKESEHNFTNTKFIINDTTWKRISNKQIPNWEEYKAKRINFKIDNLKFSPAKTSGLSEKINLSTLDFQITNETAYSYWETPLTILLLKGNKIIGINKYILKKFNSNDQKEVRITWPTNISSSHIEIIPDLNIIKKSVYITP